MEDMYDYLKPLLKKVPGMQVLIIVFPADTAKLSQRCGMAYYTNTARDSAFCRVKLEG